MENGKFTENIFLSENYNIPKKFSIALTFDLRWAIIINGYKRLLSIMWKNKYFRDIIASRIKKIENIIGRGKKFADIKDFFFDMVMHVAGVSNRSWFRNSREASFFRQ
jgi:hypothetical protein